MLSDRDIKFYLERGDIVISPFNPDQLGSNTYDVRLGNWFYTPQIKDGLIFIDDEHDVARYWGHPLRASYYIEVEPGETILAHTQEVVGGRNGITTSMRARSSIGRSSLSVCKCAGVGDVGFISRWTMEISNHSHSTMIIPVGLRVAQIEFHYVGETDHVYAGKYGQNEWTPADMLPKLHLDKDYQEREKL